MGKLNVKVVINCGGSSSGGSSSGGSGGNGGSGSGGNSGGNGGSSGTTETKYTIQIGSVTPISERTTIKYGIWDTSAGNYVYNYINVGESFEVPKDTNWVVQVETEYSETENNYETYYINGRNENKTLAIRLTQANLKRIRIVDGTSKIDDLDWRVTVNNPQGGMTSPQTDIIRDEGDIFTLLGIKSGYKSFIACNTNNLNTNINSVVNLTSLQENDLDVTLLKTNTPNYDDSMNGNMIFATRYYVPSNGHWYVDFELLVDSLGGLKVKVPEDVTVSQVYKFRNNAREISVSVDLGTTQPSNGKVAEIDIYKVSGTSFTVTEEAVNDGITSRHFDIYSQGSKE